MLRASAAVSGTGAEVNGAGGQYYARTWQTDDGLPRNTISAIAQTPDGYLWLGTPLGVIRFDGVTFTPMKDDSFAGFARARTRVLFTDDLGRLWIGTGTDGIIRYDGKTVTLINGRNGLPHPTISAIGEDFKRTVWVATEDGNLSWVDAGDAVHPVAPVNGELTRAAIQLVRDARGRLWFAQRDTYGQLRDGVATNVVQVPAADVILLCPSHDGGMWVSSGTDVQKLPPPESAAAVESIPLAFKRYQVQCLFEDHQSNLWVGTRGQGLFRYADKAFTREFAFPHRIPALFEDAEHNLWVGTEGGGLSRLRPKIFRPVNVRERLPNSMALSVCQANDGDMWLSAQGPTLMQQSARRQLVSLSPLNNIGITCVLPNPAGGIWVGTVGWGLYSIRDGHETRLMNHAAFQFRQIRVLHQDAKGQLWIGCLPDGLARLADGQATLPSAFFDEGLPKQAIWAIADDHEGRLWLGTIRGELWGYDGARFWHYGQADGLPGASIAALHASANGDLWIGTLGGGLGRLRQGRFVFTDLRHGLADDAISAIVDDGLGYFWLGTERGICRVKRQELEEFADGQRSRIESVQFGKDDGLASVECVGGYQPAAWRTRAGEIWFATSKGAVVVNPASLKPNPRPPALVLEKILVDDVAVTNRARLKLAYGYGKLEFAYTAPSFTSPERVRFRHQLVGLDPDWVAADTARSVSYPRLAPGRYVFQFTACNADGVWNDQPVAVAFEVTPAYWQTAWFKTLALLAFAGVVAGGVRYRYVQRLRRQLRQVEQAHAIERERVRIARDIHDDLGARLTQMAFLSELTAGELGQHSPAGERLGKIADGSRQAIRSLEEIVWAVNPRKDSLSDFLDFLSHYANEFFRATNLRCRQDLPLIIPAIPLSAEVRHHLFLACKETLNNILKHAQATEVWLRLKLDGSDLEVTIEDNGRGFQRPAGSAAGNGLLNLQARLAEIGGQCHVECPPGRGTCVRFTIKLPDTPPAPPETSAPVAEHP